MLSPIYVHRIEIIAFTEPGMDMSVGSINLRNKIVILPAKTGLFRNSSGITDRDVQVMANQGQENKGEKHYFIKKKEETERGS